MEKKYDLTLKTGSDFCGVGAFDFALKRLGIKQDKKFACDWDKFARITYQLNHGKPKYFPKDVYDREIPKESLDIYVTTPPCQAFSLVGKRDGENDDRGILFYNSHNFIKVNKPRYFIFENVKGLLSDDKGRTFQKWIDFLGGKSVNGNPVLFPDENAAPYHIYHFVLNARKHGIPQNRERVFIVGIRDDSDNNFKIPKEEPLVKKIKDCLESEVDEKYFLSEKSIKGFTKRRDNNFKGEFSPYHEDDVEVVKCITTNSGSRNTDNFLIVKMKRTEEAKKKRSVQMKRTGVDSGSFSDQEMVFEKQEYSDTILANPNHTKEGLILYNIYGGFGEEQPRVFDNYSPTIRTSTGGGSIPSTINNGRIRKLTPRECFRLQDFDDEFIWDVSDTQAYKQAGNSIPIGLLVKIISKLNFND